MPEMMLETLQIAIPPAAVREIRVLKLNDRKTKRQLRIDYKWDGDEANLSDEVSNRVKTYLFHGALS